MKTYHNRLSILPPILFSLVLASAAFCANQAECDACAWPYTAGVNSNGECYPTYQGYQGALGTSCAAYCNTWQAAADTLQPMYAVKAFGDAIGGSAPLCECVRLNKGGFVSYKTRPYGTCDWGVSDAAQKYWDSLAVRAAVTDSVRQAYMDSSVSDWTEFNQAIRNYEVAGYQSNNCMSAATCQDNFSFCGANCSAGPIVWVMYRRTPTYTCVAVPLPPGKGCLDFYNQEPNSAPALDRILENQVSAEKGLESLRSDINAVGKSVSGSQNAVLNAIAASDSTLMARMNNIGGGSGDPVDLQPVLDAIGASRDSVVSSVYGASVGSRDSVVRALDVMENRFAARHMEVVDSFASLGNSLNGIAGSIDALTDTVASGNRQLGYLTDSISSGNRSIVGSIDDFVDAFNEKLDRGYNLDEASKSVFDSIYSSLGRSEGISRQQLDSSISGFNRLHGDLRAIKDSLKITVVDSTDDQMDSLDLGRLIDTVHRFHESFGVLTDSIKKWHNAREARGDSLYRAWKVDSVLNSDPYFGIDTAALAAEAASYFDNLRGVVAAESSYVVGMVPDGTCTDFPNDPQFELAFLGRLRVTIPMADAHPTLFSFMRAIIFLAAYVTGFFFWVQCLNWALDMNRWMTSGSGRI